MRISLVAVLLLAASVSACAAVRDSRLNPVNWFGRSERAAAVATAPAERQQLVQQVLTMVVEPTTGGAILRATGLPPTQGFWDAALVAEDSERPDELVFRFVLAPPPSPRPAVTPVSREVTVATFLTRQTLEGVRRITVTGASNARTTARR
jgi:hypothetical protein